VREPARDEHPESTHFVQLSDLVRDAVIGADDQHRVTYWNPAATALLGWSAEEAAGCSALELLRVTFPGTTLSDVLNELETADRTIEHDSRLGVLGRRMEAGHRRADHAERDPEPRL